jgi:NIMA (never in mitosis gene a)-related kinase
VWALGCVLYELCTLKHAFSADNLLGLVYKIVQDKYEPIPSSYSKELNNLINALLNKNASERPSVAQILQMPIVRSKMLEFV